jgi:SAM-dependent methyltransferase
LNWGFWHEVGIVATESYQSRLNARGVRGIATAEGLEAVGRSLGHELPQVLVWRGRNELLRDLGTDLQHQIRLVTETLPAGSARAAAAAVRAPQLDADLLRRFKAGDEALIRYASARLLRIFQDLGVFQRMGDRYDRFVLRNQLRIIPEYARLFDALLTILVNAGHLEVHGAHIVCRQTDAPPASTEPGDCDETSAQFAFLRACLDAYEDVLTGARPHTDVLFPEGSKHLVEPIYRGNRITGAYNQLTAHVAAVVAGRLHAARPERALRILEIGAGTGGTTSFLLAALAPYRDNLSYVYSDVSAAFVEHGRRSFSADHPYMEFQLLDIERDAIEQGLKVGGFDVVLAANVVHATRDILGTLWNIKPLLSRNGTLVLTEINRVHPLATMTFGLTTGWWHFQDPQLRMPHSPLLDWRRWYTALAATGFQRPAHLLLPGTAATHMEQAVIIAESDGTYLAATAPESLATTAPAPANDEPVQGQPRTGAAGVKSAPVPDRAREYVRQIFAEVLKVPAPQLGLDDTFEQHGVDSLIGMSIVSRLEQDLGPLPATLLFEHTSLARLADYLTARFPDSTPFAAAEIVNTPHHNRDASLEPGIRDYVRAVFGEVLRTEITAADEDTFEAHGVDSLIGMEILRRFERDLGPLPATLLFEHQTIAKLGAYLAEHHRVELISLFAKRADAEPMPAPQPSPTPPPTADETAPPAPAAVEKLVESLSDAEVDQLLDVLHSSA